MPQISLYVDKETMKRITRSAKREKKSVSAWVREHVVRETRPEWPQSFLDTFGSLKDSDLKRPLQPSLKDDGKRNPL